jgi:uncharacterized membrane protein YgdD (TMEM256/DUF423 family)
MESAWLLRIGSVYGLLAVALGAFGAHGLKAKVEPELLSVWKTAAEYQLAHAVLIVLLGLLAQSKPTAGFAPAGWVIAAGVLIFSGSLYALVLSGIKPIGAITPIGGTLLIIGWALLLRAACR